MKYRFPRTVFSDVEPLPDPNEEEWHWLRPDPLLPPTHRYYPVRSTAPNPAVMQLGEADNSENSPACWFTREWQLFDANLKAYAGFSKPYEDLTPEQKDAVKQCFSGTYGTDVAYTNGHGFDDYSNYVTGEIKSTGDPKFPKALRGETDSIQGPVILNSRGEKVIKVATFDFWAGPPTSYGIEILKDPRVGYATIIGKNGAVYNFPPRGLPLYTSIPVPTITVTDVHIPLAYCITYTGERRPIGYVPPVMLQVKYYLMSIIRSVLYAR